MSPRLMYRPILLRSIAQVLLLTIFQVRVCNRKWTKFGGEKNFSLARVWWVFIRCILQIMQEGWKISSTGEAWITKPLREGLVPRRHFPTFPLPYLSTHSCYDPIYIPKCSSLNILFNPLAGVSGYIVKGDTLSSNISLDLSFLVFLTSSLIWGWKHR